MMIWVPYPNLRLAAHVMDTMRLGRQFNHGVHILRLVLGSVGAPLSIRSERPCPVMWYGYGPALVYYMDLMVQELQQRGYPRNTPRTRTGEGAHAYGFPPEWAFDPPVMPAWLGMARLHASHRAALLFHDANWYQQFCWEDAPRMEIFWPGRVPAPGEMIVSPRGVPYHVVSLEPTGEVVAQAQGTGSRILVSREEIYSRAWRRGVTSDVPLHR
jgi:hypothetical protein